ncbi:MAG: lamin tail domain-containing protein, partial [Archangium sp.]|nr:lamin tail domain-containing protein [Archangium sp.]
MRCSLLAAVAVVMSACGPELATRVDALGSTTFVINAVYGGGGSSGATHRNDFIELRNVSSAQQSLSGLTLQYASVLGSSWTVTDLTPTMVPSGGYYLVQYGSGGSQGAPLPSADATNSSQIAISDFKVALVTGNTPLSGDCPRSNAAALARIVDFIGAGPTVSCSEMSPAPQPSATTSVA